MREWLLVLLWLIDWLAVSVSFFNTIALLWLGLFVLFNAERRTWGAWVAGGGLALGGLIYAGHTAVVARVIGTYNSELEFWWRAIWVPVAVAPYIWYLGTLWYSGLFADRRYRPGLWLVSLLGVLILWLLLLENSLPTVREIWFQLPGSAPTIGGIPAVVLLYPIYSLLCISLSLAALRHPVASRRFMGDLARARARPWLIAAGLALLGACLLFGIGTGWFLVQLQGNPTRAFLRRALVLFIAGDLVISLLIALATILIGRAIVAYEVFTGSALPRGQLSRHWRRSLMLATGYGAAVSASLMIPLDPVYRLLLATLLMTLFFALLSWRAYVDHQQGIARLRPFVASERLYDRLLRQEHSDADTRVPFQALCDDVLGACTACLIPLGPLAALAGAPLLYAPQHPETVAPHPSELAELVGRLGSPQVLCVPLDPTRYSGAIWAVPLWSERGLSGALLLGEKRDGGLYTEEEMAIARATSERLLDTRAGAEMARRLMDLQRRRLAESQVLDQRTRRTLHDEVLPLLHAAMLRIAGDREGEAGEEALGLLTDAHRQISNLLHALPAPITYEVGRFGLIGALQRMVAADLNGAFGAVRWQVATEAAEAAQTLPALAAEVLFGAAREAIRNAARHAPSSDSARPLCLTLDIRCCNRSLELRITDDGIGMTASNNESRGGHGLALHSTMMAVIGGALTIERSTRSGTCVLLTLPL